MTKAVAIIVAVLFVLSSNFLSVAVSAADYNKIDISDYVSGREFSGNDVLVTYDLPLRPFTELYGFASGSNTPHNIASINGNLYFSQDYIDSVGTYFDSLFYFDPIDFNPSLDQSDGQWMGEMQFQMSTEEYEEFISCTHMFVDGALATLVWDSINPTYGSAYGHASNDGIDIFQFQLDGASGTFAIYWNNDNIPYDSFDIEFGLLREVEYDYAEYQRINGKISPLGQSNGAANIIDVHDIRSGYGFTLSFDLKYTIEHDSETDLNGNIAYFDAVWLDKNHQEVSRTQYEIDYAPYESYQEFNFDIDFIVPQGASYFYLEFVTGYFYVNTAYEVSWVIDNISMSALLSSIEENSQTMQKVQQKLDKLDEQLGDIKDQLTPTPEQNDKAEQLEQEIGNASDKLENNNSTLEDLTPTRPEINTDLTLDEEKLFAVSPLITNIWSLSGMQSHIGIVVLVATVAYIFFGKRDS